MTGYHFDAQPLLLAAHHMDGFELAALDTLQHGLAGDPQCALCLPHRREVLAGITAEVGLDVIAAIRTVFQRFAETGSARRVWLWFRDRRGLKSAMQHSRAVLRCAILLVRNTGALAVQRREFITLLGGAAAAWPLAAHAQQRERMRRIGVLAGQEKHLPEFEAFRKQLQDLAYIEGENLAIDWRYADRGPGQLPILAKELVNLHPDVIVSITTPATAAVKAATGSIPIVFAYVGDPVETGFVASLSHPGGNMTGQSILMPQLSGKRLELLKETIPTSSTIAVVGNPTNPAVRLSSQETQDAAPLLGIRLVSIEVRAAGDIASAFEIAKQEGAQGVIVLPDPLTGSHRSAIIELAAKVRMPTMYGYREYVDEGGFMAYGPNYRAVFRRAAVYVDKILKGSKPADLPVEQPTKLELVINLKTAKALGLDIPPALLARADEVIE